MRRFFRSSFGSALLGGAVVAAFGWVAIAAGWIETDGGGSAATVAQSPTVPVASRDADGSANFVNEIYERDAKGVAFVNADRSGGGEDEAPLPGPFGGPEREGGAASGSGFLIDTDGHVITNSHVVDGAEDVDVTLGSSDRSYEAEIVGADPATDVALLKIDAPADRLHPLQLGDSSKVRVGDPVVAIGNPFGLDQTVTSGIVSALHRQIRAPNGFSISQVVQTDAAINPGNSGGPLIDPAQGVIGINSQIQTGGNPGNVGIGFAVPINTAKEVVRQLQESGEVKHAYLGVEGGSVTPDLARALELPVDSGVLVGDVVEGGPADDAGLRGGDSTATIEGSSISVGGDIIVEVNGERIGGMEEVINLVNEAKPGERMRLTVRRGDSTKRIVVTLGERPESAQDAQSGPVGPPSR